jgi:hypothetical protein
LLNFDDEGNADYEGQTTIDWNAQVTVRDAAGRATLARPQGHQWPAVMDGAADNENGPTDNTSQIAVIFRCPQCGGHRLEEVMTDVFVSSEVLYCDAEGGMEYGQEANDGGEVDRYQCLDCGWVVPDVKTAEDLWQGLHDLRTPEQPE